MPRKSKTDELIHRLALGIGKGPLNKYDSPCTELTFSIFTMIFYETSAVYIYTDLLHFLFSANHCISNSTSCFTLYVYKGLLSEIGIEEVDFIDVATQIAKTYTGAFSKVLGLFLIVICIRFYFVYFICVCEIVLAYLSNTKYIIEFIKYNNIM